MDKGYYWYHAKVQEYVIQECTDFRKIVQNLMDRKEIEFSKSNDPSIDVITGITYSRTPSSTGPMPITIFHDNEVVKDEMPKAPIPILNVEVPRPFPYKSQKECLGTTTAIIPTRQSLLTSSTSEALLEVGVIMPLIWQKRLHLRSF